MSIKAKYLGEFESEIIFENQLKIKTNSNRNLHDSCEQTKPSNLLSASLACCISTTLGIILEKNNIESKSFYVDIISKSDVQNNKISTLHCKICLPLIKKLKIKNFIKEKIESSFISNSLKESINISYEYIFNR
ncbi:hypothetical protein EU96_1355 [Prochlorococcus marinus str. MIT 9302]|uniref:Osmotically inducible protein OsmC n=1 Tax=Prochlorococcus marinus str. MIT 9302 TaxID=74545 RepID=A0A0A2AA05_PROMR|nr:OsmC family protein [Prochlorococcus marinus]KGF97641.1 hypothetical protein EU96_1355 [Prochlorococcus marinus str. MIT 9302]